jgi:hypothetical protein
LQAQTMPNDAAAVLTWLSGEVQRASLPYTFYGELGFRLSGYAINQLQSSLDTVLRPFVSCVEQSYFVECRELLKQYQNQSFAPLAVRGRDSKNKAFGFSAEQYIKSADITGEWIPEVTIVPTLPKDDAQRLEMARLATQSEKPILSMRTVRTDYLGLQDADQEDAQVALEWADNLMMNRLYQAYMSAVADKDTDRAKNILVELKRMIVAQGGNQGGARGGQAGQSPTEKEATENAGNGVPAPPTAMSTETMPPETLGGMPPGSASAAPMPFEE